MPAAAEMPAAGAIWATVLSMVAAAAALSPRRSLRVCMQAPVVAVIAVAVAIAWRFPHGAEYNHWQWLQYIGVWAVRLVAVPMPRRRHESQCAACGRPAGRCPGAVVCQAVARSWTGFGAVAHRKGRACAYKRML